MTSSGLEPAIFRLVRIVPQPTTLPRAEAKKFYNLFKGRLPENLPIYMCLNYTVFQSHIMCEQFIVGSVIAIFVWI
jgi:hypothetical protein